MNALMSRERVQVGLCEAPGELALPPDACGLVVFAHGGASSGQGPSDARIAETLHSHGLATLLIDPLGAEEPADRRSPFDIERLASRVTDVLDWAMRHDTTARLPLGLLGAGAGAAAALLAAARRGGHVGAVVSRGGRTELAAAATLERVEAPTLLIVGGANADMLARNRDAMRRLRGRKRLEIVPGASHRFAEPGALDAAAHLAGAWFANHLAPRRMA